MQKHFGSPRASLPSTCKLQCLFVVMGVPPTHADPLGSAGCCCCRVLPSVFPMKCFQPPKQEFRLSVPCVTKRTCRHQGTVSQGRAGLACPGLAERAAGVRTSTARCSSPPARPRGGAAVPPQPAGVGSCAPRARAALRQPPGRHGHGAGGPGWTLAGCCGMLRNTPLRCLCC